MKKPAEHENRSGRLAQQKNAPVAQLTDMVNATKDRVTNTRRMIAQSKTLLGKARKALDSSKSLREIEAPRRPPAAKP